MRKPFYEQGGKETSLGDVAMKEANAAVEKVLEQEHNEVEGRKIKHTQFTSKQRAKIGKYTVET